MRALLAALTITLCLSVGFADEAETGKKPPAGAKKVLVSFEEDLVRGSMTGAELFMILQKKQTSFEHLFDLKNDFNQEMIQGADSLK